MLGDIKGTDLNNMKGITKQTVNGLSVEYYDEDNNLTRTLPIYKGDKIPYVGCIVNFKIVDEFSHPHLFEDVSWGDGVKCAKLIN